MHIPYITGPRKGKKFTCTGRSTLQNCWLVHWFLTDSNLRLKTQPKAVGSAFSRGAPLADVLDNLASLVNEPPGVK